jgi:5-methyltetrahydropteroyltriglutamate--homocysteine methyltransferase
VLSSRGFGKMIVQAALVGGFPRPFNTGRLMSRYRDGKLTQETYEKKIRIELLKTIRRIADSNVSIIPFNMFLWDDIFEPFASSFEGVERGGLYRFLDNNFYYRVPVVKGRIKHREATLTHLKMVKSIIKQNKLRLKIKAVIPGPYTFAKMCENKHYSSEDALVTDVAEALGEEARMLERLGAKFIEIHEPLLASGNVSMELFKKGFETLTSKVSSKTWLQTYFGSVSQLLEELTELKIDVLGVDLAEAPNQFEAISGLKIKRGIGLGAVDSRSTRVETVSSMRMLVKKAGKNFREIYLTPNAMMDFIPVSIAYAKIRRMGIAIRRL